MYLYPWYVIVTRAHAPWVAQLAFIIWEQQTVVCVLSEISTTWGLSKGPKNLIFLICVTSFVSRSHDTSDRLNFLRIAESVNETRSCAKLTAYSIAYNVIYTRGFQTWWNSFGVYLYCPGNLHLPSLHPPFIWGDRLSGHFVLLLKINSRLGRVYVGS